MLLKNLSQLTENQWRCTRHWIVVTAIAEGLMLLFNRYLAVIYLIIAVLFLAGFGLRVFNVYPGKREPPLLDSSAVAVALVFAYVADRLGASFTRFIVIFVSSLIILPHLIYIVSRRDM